MNTENYDLIDVLNGNNEIFEYPFFNKSNELFTTTINYKKLTEKMNSEFPNLKWEYEDDLYIRYTVKETSSRLYIPDVIKWFIKQNKPTVAENKLDAFKRNSL